MSFSKIMYIFVCSTANMKPYHTCRRWSVGHSNWWWLYIFHWRFMSLWWWSLFMVLWMSMCLLAKVSRFQLFRCWRGWYHETTSCTAGSMYEHIMLGKQRGWWKWQRALYTEQTSTRSTSNCIIVVVLASSPQVVRTHQPMHCNCMFLKTLDGTKPHSAQVARIRHKGRWSHGVVIAWTAPASIWWSEQTVGCQAGTWACLMLRETSKFSQFTIKYWTYSEWTREKKCELTMQQ